MSTNISKTIPKITVKIWRPILEKLDVKLDAACLRRDAYLIRLLEGEIDYLDKEVSIPNSQASYAHVAKQLDHFDRKPVSLALPSELTSRLNEICDRKRIVRDAFFNRLFLLLAASPKTIDKLFLLDDDWRTNVWIEWKHDGPFFQNGFYPLEASIDPFWAIRAALDINAEDTGADEAIDSPNGKSRKVMHLLNTMSPAASVYANVFTTKVDQHNLIGLSCSLPDWQIPGHKAETEMRRTLDDLIGDL